MLSLLTNGLSVPARTLEFGSAPHYPANGECATPNADPPVPGVLGGGPTLGAHAHVVLGIAPDYPPYTAWGGGDGEPIALSGFSYEIGGLFEPMCGIKVDYALSTWSQCWTKKENTRSAPYFAEIAEYVGDGIEAGIVHGCAAYTHTKGERGLSLDFTHAVLGDLKTAGILTRLEGGAPVVSPSLTDYSNVKLCDVTGWAPTLDTFKFNKNYCTSDHAKFVGTPTAMAEDGPAFAVQALKDGTCDALYIYSDTLKGELEKEAPASWASGFGTEIGYIHTGLDQWSLNGTTFAISKKGSGLPALLNPCIDKVVQTAEYRAICEKYFSPTSCIGGTDEILFYDATMDTRTDAYTCADGYCTCTE